MRSAAELARVVDALRAPIEELVRETRVRVALVVNGAGQVLAQHGFSRGYELVNVAALAAAANASSRMLAEMTGLVRWRHLHHAGKERELFLAPLRTPAEELILVAIFDEDSSLGVVQLFFERFATRVAALEPLQVQAAPKDAWRFEKDLEAGLERVFPVQP